MGACNAARVQKGSLEVFGGIAGIRQLMGQEHMEVAATVGSSD